MIYLELFLAFLKIGAFTFGGGLAMLPLMEEAVNSHPNWGMDPEGLVNFIAVSESTPGPIAVNMATYIGFETGGFLGAAIATLGVVLPSFVIILLVAKFYQKYKNSFIVDGCMKGLRPIVIGLLSATAVSLAIDEFIPLGLVIEQFNYEFFCSIVIFAAALFIALKFKKFNPIFLILASAGVGLIVGYAGEWIFPS